MGPRKGMSEMCMAADAPVRARTSGSCLSSAEMTVAITWTSALNPSGNMGRMGRSMRRETSVSWSLGRPIYRRQYEPGILPAAYIFST